MDFATHYLTYSCHDVTTSTIPIMPFMPVKSYYSCWKCFQAYMNGAYSNISHHLHDHVNSHKCINCCHNMYIAIMRQLLYTLVHLLVKDYSSNTFYRSGLHRNLLHTSSVNKKTSFSDTLNCYEHSFKTPCIPNDQQHLKDQLL